jgi:hypothetical protein
MRMWPWKPSPSDRNVETREYVYAAFIFAIWFAMIVVLTDLYKSPTLFRDSVVTSGMSIFCMICAMLEGSKLSRIIGVGILLAQTLLLIIWSVPLSE